MATPPKAPYAALIGLDWADQEHTYCLSVMGTNAVETGVIPSRPEDVAAWINQLRKRFKGQPIALALEQSRGALIHQLMSVEFIDLYPINPQALAHFRKAFAVSQAKDDPTDAQLMWEYLLKHRDRLRVWTPEDVDTRMLALLVEDRRKMLDLRTQLSNKLTATLKGYFPQALELIGTKVASPMACDFLQRWPSLGAIKKCRDHTLEQFYIQHQVRNRAQIATRIALIRESVPLLEDAAIVETSALKVKSLSRQIACLNEDLDQYEQHIATLFETHPEHALFEALPGAGAALAPGCWSPWVRIGRALTGQRRSPPFPEWRRSPSAVGNTPGSIGGWPVPNFSGRPFMNLPICPATNPLGPTPIMKRNAPGESPIMPP
jgi:transposase